MEFRLLGPLEILDADLTLELGGVKQRSLLAVLVLHANEIVSVDRLREIGIITADELPQEYVEVIDSFTPDEVETLVSIKKRLDFAQEVSGESTDANMVAP